MGFTRAELESYVNSTVFPPEATWTANTGFRSRKAGMTE